MTYREVPTTIIEGKEWLLLKALGDKFTIRAAKIEKRKERVRDSPSDHRVDEATAQGGVKCQCKHWDIGSAKL